MRKERNLLSNQPVSIDWLLRTRKNSDDVNKEVGRRVRRLRREKELTQGQLAKRAGITPNTLRGLERGTLNTRWPKLQRVAKALGTTAETLIQGDEPLKPTDPLLVGLTIEDLRIARAYHDSGTPQRLQIRAFLKLGGGDRITAIIEKLVDGDELTISNIERLAGLVTDLTAPKTKETTTKTS